MTITQKAVLEFAPWCSDWQTCLTGIRHWSLFKFLLLISGAARVPSICIKCTTSWAHATSSSKNIRKVLNNSNLHFITSNQPTLKKSQNKTSRKSFLSLSESFRKNKTSQSLLWLKHMRCKETLYTKLALMLHLHNLSSLSWVINGYWHHFGFSDRLSFKVVFWP